MTIMWFTAAAMASSSITINSTNLLHSQSRLNDVIAAAYEYQGSAAIAVFHPAAQAEAIVLMIKLLN